MYRCLVILFFLYSFLIPGASAQNTSTDATQLVNQSRITMGGVEELKAIKLIHTKSVGHYYLLEQSERPEGPWLSINQATEEWRDVDNGYIHRSYEQTGVFEGKTVEITAGGMSIMGSGGGFRPNPNNVAPMEELLATAPERVLLNALAATDLKFVGTEVVQGTRN